MIQVATISFWATRLKTTFAMNSSQWLPTSAASQALGRSPSFLKRLRDTHGGFLELGRHYSLAPSRTAPITWNVTRIQEELNKRARIARAADTLPKLN